MSRESFEERVPENVPGKFYVNQECTDCDLCRETAPALFARNDDEGWSYVKRQPETEEELALARECVEVCCMECIYSDGDAHDWSLPGKVQSRLDSDSAMQKPKCGCCGRKKPWWRFW